MSKIPAQYFSGHKSNCEKVSVSINATSLIIDFSDRTQAFSHSEYKTQAPFANCPLIVELEDASRIEIDLNDMDKNQRAIMLTRKSKLLYFLESNWIAVLISFCTFLLFCYFFATSINPVISQFLAKKIPISATIEIDKTILKSLKKQYLVESKLSSSEKLRIENLFKFHYRDMPTLYFYSSPILGSNAFALSGNTVIITDELVKKLKNRDQLFAIFMHEISHLKNRHLLSQLISASFLGTLTFFVVGNLPGATESLAGLAATLIGLSYSRKFETEADTFAVEYLHKNKISPRCLSSALEIITKDIKDLDSSTLFSYVSTHPQSKERMNSILKKFPNAPACN